RDNLVGGNLHQVGEFADRHELVNTDARLLAFLLLGGARRDDVAVAGLIGPATIAPAATALDAGHRLVDVGLHCILVVEVLASALAGLLAPPTGLRIRTEGAHGCSIGRGSGRLARCDREESRFGSRATRRLTGGWLGHAGRDERTSRCPTCARR